jgi:hypothetical protein
MINVLTVRNVSGETGKPLVQDFGRATYDYLSDQIKYRRP